MYKKLGQSKKEEEEEMREESSLIQILVDALCQVCGWLNDTGWKLDSGLEVLEKEAIFSDKKKNIKSEDNVGDSRNLRKGKWWCYTG